MDRRRALALMAMGATAAAQPAYAIGRQAAGGVDLVQKQFRLNPKGSGPTIVCKGAALPGGGFQWSWRPSRSKAAYVRAFEADGSPIGGPRAVVSGTQAGGPFEGKATGLVSFADGSSLFIYTGRGGDDPATRVYAVPLSPAGVRGRPTPVSADGEAPTGQLLAARIGGDAAIVAWRSKTGAADALRWRLVGRGGKPSGSTRSLDLASSKERRTLLSLVGLSGGGAVLGFSRSDGAATPGALCVQRLDRSGEALGAVQDLGVTGGFVGLAALPGGRFMAFRSVDPEIIGVRFSDADGVLGAESAVDSGVAASGPPCAVGVDAGRVILLVSGTRRRRRAEVAAAILLDERGAVIGEPLTVGKGTFAPTVRSAPVLARDAILLDGGDVLLAWSSDGPVDLDDALPLHGAIVRVR